MPFEATFSPSTFKPLDSLRLFHILRSLPRSICPHSSWQVWVFLSPRPDRHGCICLNFSFPVWGVHPIPCSRAQHTSNTLKTLLLMRKERQIWWYSQSIQMRELFQNYIRKGGRTCVEKKSGWYVRTEDWKNLTDDTDQVKGKWVGSRKVANYHNPHK